MTFANRIADADKLQQEINKHLPLKGQALKQLRGKGDHRHIKGQEEPYLFESVKKLALDFYEAVRLARKSGGI